MIKLIYVDILYPEFWLSDAMHFMFRINLDKKIIDDDPINL